MLSPRQRSTAYGGAALAAVWIVAMTGYYLAKNSQATAVKVRAYVESVDLRNLSGDARARAIRRLADMINALSLEERQRLRIGQMAGVWFEAMTEEEKAQFIEATMPTGFKQMITAFEELPEEKRQRAIDDALKRLRETNQKIASGQGLAPPTNAPPISDELQAKIRTIGLKSFYSQSSAQTKAELAPVLEELQRAMESGRLMRGR